jgi:TorA maturation chaperone TorD
LTGIAVDWPTALMGEMVACGLLSKALYVYPERAWLQTLIDEEVFSLAPFAETQPEMVVGLALLQRWAAAQNGDLSPEAFGDLRADYTQLFIGVGAVKAPPWESVYFSEDRLIFQEQTLQVRRWYQRYGLQVQRLNQEPDDHLGLELAFLAHLAQAGVAALEQGHDAAAAELLDAQADFLAEHPLRWAAQWNALVQQHARTDFYRGIARLTVGVLAELAALFDLRLAESAVQRDQPQRTQRTQRLGK